MEIVSENDSPAEIVSGVDIINISSEEGPSNVGL
jgi:hypothetical protein